MTLSAMIFCVHIEMLRDELKECLAGASFTMIPGQTGALKDKEEQAGG